jgi:hypothetical protein
MTVRQVLENFFTAAHEDHQEEKSGLVKAK